MTCQHCVNAITSGLNQLPGAASVVVDLHERRATLQLDTSSTTDTMDVDAIKTLVSQTIEDLGYDAGTPSVSPLSPQHSGSAVLHVNGMTCSSCVQTITTALSQSPLVVANSIDISLDSRLVKFQLDQQQRVSEADRQALVDMVNNLGYEVVKASFSMDTEDDNNSSSSNDDADVMYSATVSIIGMTCSHCVRAVTSGLQSLPGVVGDSVDVNLDKHEAKFSFEKGMVTAQLLVDTIQDLGYDVPQRPRIIAGSTQQPLSLTETTTSNDPLDFNEEDGLLPSPQSSDGGLASAAAAPWSKVVMRVGGLTCESCVANLTDAFYSLENVQPNSVHVDLQRTWRC
ncbi:unnamed protein product [Absidia cylindrospora]